jgi:anaphase-promoting complex subunit 5
VPWLTAAEEEYGKISVPTSLADVQFFLSVVYHNLGNLPERDAAAQRNIQSERLAEKLSSIVIEDEALDVWKLVTEIGAALSMRY